MKKILVLLLAVFVSSFLLTSCVSLFPEIEERSVTLPSSNRERSSAAINLLGSDMIKAVVEERVVPSDYESILSPSYVLYEEFSPRYETLKNTYLADVAGYAYRLLCSYKNQISDEVLKLSRSPNEFISGDTTLSDRLRTNLWNQFYDKLVQELRENKSLLDEYYEASKRNFGEIRKAYANLDNVGVSFVLPSPVSISLEKLAETATDHFFDKLAWHEKFLKNTPAEAGTLYTVFWEN